MDHKALETYFFIALLLGALVLGFFVLLPYLSALILAGVFAVIFRPAYRRVLRLFGKRRAMAAFLTAILAFVVVFTPLFYLGWRVFQEATGLYVSLTVGSEGGGISAAINGFLHAYGQSLNLQQANFQVQDALRQILSWLLNNLGPVFSGLTQVLVILFLSLIGFYYLLKDGETFKNKMVSLLPLSDRYAEKILERLESTVNSVFKGQMVIALIQGTLAGIGFAIFGVPNATFWGSLTVIAALIPTLGTSVVVFPAVIYLYLTGQTFESLGLLVWGSLAVGLIDNVLAPHLMRRGTPIHPFFILLSVLGGIVVFGPIGFLAGPLIVSFIYALLDIYPTLILHSEG